MEERSKTNKEIFEQEYPLEKVKDNPMICAEAIGYLKSLIKYFPSEKKWVETEMANLMLMLLFYSL